jgi:hypothetical protein
MGINGLVSNKVLMNSINDCPERYSSLIKTVYVFGLIMSISSYLIFLIGFILFPWNSLAPVTLPEASFSNTSSASASAI